MTAKIPDANEIQRHYWNTIAGPRWVASPGFRERRNQESLALLLDCLRLAGGESVLEIGCGTGATSAALAAAVGPRGRVVAADISAPMLEAARRRLAEAGLDRVELVSADAQTHPFAPAAFDLIASRFGVMFFADPQAAFANFLAAARPGGRLCFACWGRLAENRHWLVPLEVVIRHLGPPAPSDPRAPGPFAFGDPDYVRGFLAAAGWSAIEIARETPLLHIDDPEKEAERVTAMGPAARLIEDRQPDAATRAAIHRDIAATFAGLAENGAIRLGGTVLLVSARRK
jgi:SAM-dependent methyltransferase